MAEVQSGLVRVVGHHNCHPDQIFVIPNLFRDHPNNMKSHNYYVYILTNFTNTTPYIGVTNNLERRTLEHRSESIPGFTKHYHITKLIYYEEFSRIEDGIAREKQLKNWHRDWKFNLIKSSNPKLLDLFET